MPHPVKYLLKTKKIPWPLDNKVIVVVQWCLKNITDDKYNDTADDKSLCLTPDNSCMLKIDDKKENCGCSNVMNINHLVIFRGPKQGIRNKITCQWNACNKGR